jgi:16S rRNA G966 N2-methylase RsmD
MININEEHSKYVKLYSFSSGSTSPTDRKLVKEIVSHLDIEVLKNPTSKFLDPCAGVGTFGVMIYNELLKYHEPKWILEKMIFMVDTLRVNCDIIKQLGFVNVYNEDYLKLNLNMKFDVIIGNPPFQSGKGETGGRTALWRYFVKKSFSLLNDGGILSFVTPQFPNSSKDLGDIFVKNQTLWVNTDVKKYFKEGSTFFTWAVKNVKKQTTTKFLFENVDIDITKNELPNIVSEKSISIIEKIKHKESIEILFSEGVNHNKLKEQTEYQSPVYSELYCYKIRRTVGNTLYSYTSILPTYYRDNKITFTKSGKPNFKYHDGNVDPVGSIKHMSGIILCQNSDIANNMIWVFENSKLSKFYSLCLNSGGMNGFNFIRPNINYSQPITDDMIYSYYGLTQEEIQTVISNVE